MNLFSHFLPSQFKPICIGGQSVNIAPRVGIEPPNVLPTWRQWWPLHHLFSDVTSISLPTCLCGSLPEKSVCLLHLFRWKCMFFSIYLVNLTYAYILQVHQELISSLVQNHRHDEQSCRGRKWNPISCIPHQNIPILHDLGSLLSAAHPCVYLSSWFLVWEVIRD